MPAYAYRYLCLLVNNVPYTFITQRTPDCGDASNSMRDGKEALTEDEVPFLEKWMRPQVEQGKVHKAVDSCELNLHDDLLISAEGVDEIFSLCLGHKDTSMHETGDTHDSAPQREWRMLMPIVQKFGLEEERESRGSVQNNDEMCRNK